MDKQNLFTTGEMAKACRTTKDTLYFYERKGLIKPAFVDSNGYRYYDLENYYRMDMIAMLRESGSTVKESSRFIENLTPETYLRYMRLKKEFFRQKQIEYKLLEEKIQRSVELTEESFSICCCTP